MVLPEPRTKSSYNRQCNVRAHLRIYITNIVGYFLLGYLEIPALTRHKDRDGRELSCSVLPGGLTFQPCMQPWLWTHFSVGSAVSTVEHISVTCGCSIPGAGACLMDSVGASRRQTPELEPISSQCPICQLLLPRRKRFLSSLASLLPVSVHASCSACFTYFRYSCISILVTAKNLFFFFFLLMVVVNILHLWPNLDFLHSHRGKTLVEIPDWNKECWIHPCCILTLQKN